MTNNEAAKWIQLYIDLAKIDPTTGEAAYLNDDDKKTIEAMEMAVNTLTAQPEKTQLSEEEATSDCISRQAAINAVEFGITYAKAIDVNTGESKELFKEGNDALKKASERVKDLPSAQAETHEKRTETHACDCIERQAAIDAILAVTGNSSVRELYEHVQEHELSDMWSGGVVAAIDTIIALPSAQPDVPDTNVGDTISRQVVVDTVHKIILGFFSEKNGAMTDTEKTLLSVNKAVCNELAKLPSAQPEIIRCKDCKWHQGAECVRFADVRPFADDFCSRAERRTDG